MKKEKKTIFAYDTYWAANFDARMQMVVPGYNLIHSVVASFLRSITNPTSDILVIGAGTGSDIVTLCTYNADWKITGIDPSPEMLKVAHNKISASCSQSEVKLECCKIEDFEADAKYDVAILSLVMQLYPDDGSKLELLRASAQCLKPRGILILVDTYGDYDSPQFEQTLESLKIQTTQCGLSKAQAEKDIESIRERFYFISEQRIRSLLNQARFDSIELIFHAFITGAWLAVRTAR